MKKKLLKVPSNDGEIFLLPSYQKLLGLLRSEQTIGVVHQPYFFNPGVSLKFLFLECLPLGNKKIIFLDIDRVYLSVKIPGSQGVRIIDFIQSQQVLVCYPTPKQSLFSNFFNVLDGNLKSVVPGSIYSTFSSFREIVSKNCRRHYLKEVLAQSFLEFYGIERDYEFISSLLGSKAYKDFFYQIYRNDSLFRDIFNQALAEYRQEFRFRFKNFPFPKLEVQELPFWLIKDGVRLRCFKKDIDMGTFNTTPILPRASTLTLFLRLNVLDMFIHGVGAANYEWVQDRIIERFFKQKPSTYAVISGTFYLDNFKIRDFPYFLYEPDVIGKSLNMKVEKETPVSSYAGKRR